MSGHTHETAAPPEVTLYPEHIRAVTSDRPAPPALVGLIEVERRLEDLAGKLEYRYPLRPFPYHVEELSLLHDAVDELRAAVATIAGGLGLL